MRARTDWSDQYVEQCVAALLRAGLMIATALVVAGAVLYLARHGGEPVDYRVFSGEPAALRGLGGIAGVAAQGSGRGLIQLGLLVLLATPVLRVAFSIYAFLMQRDRLYVAVTVFVLGVLLYSVLGVGR